MESFQCNDSNETIHFKFDRFDLEDDYDFLLIGYSEQFEHFHDNFFEPNGYEIERPNNKTGLMLDGSQPLHTWVNAQSIPDFNIVFGRNVLSLKTIFCSL